MNEQKNNRKLPRWISVGSFIILVLSLVWAVVNNWYTQRTLVQIQSNDIKHFHESIHKIETRLTSIEGQQTKTNGRLSYIEGKMAQ